MPSSTKAFEQQVETATRLFFADKTKNREEVTGIAEGYLTHWIQGENTITYYSRILVPELAGKGLAYPTHADLCWFFLLEYDPPKALSLAAGWYAAGLYLVDDN